MSAPTTFEPGTQFGPYRLLRELGRGGMGTVYLAEVSAADASSTSPITSPNATPADGDVETGRDISHEIDVGVLGVLPPGTLVAIKTFHPHLVSTKDFARRFRREARVGAAIQHPNVVRTFDAGTAPLRGTPTNYLAMEFVEGQTLRDLIREMGKVPEELARTVARQVAAGLDAIHKSGITHRDLKPENVILTKDHHVKLMDLGVAKVREESIRLSLTGQFLGSVHYAAPEQFRAPETVDARADIYALGVLLHEMLAGSNPFFHDDLRVVLRKSLSEVPRRLALVVPDLAPVLDQLAATLVEKNPADRIQTASEVLGVLEHGEESAWWKSSGRRMWSQSAGRVVRRMQVARDIAIVGRDDELRALRQQFDIAVGGARRVVLLEGEPGIGKTRIADEFAASLAEQAVRFQFLFGVAPPPGTGRPFHAFSDALRQSLEPEDPRAALAALLPAGSPVDEFYALVTGTPGGELPVERSQALFAAAFRALAAREPLVIVVDDLHLAGSSSANLLAYLAHDEPTSPILLIAALRPPDESSPLHAIVRGNRDANLVPITVGRLGPRDVGQFLRHALKSERLVQELGFRLLEKTEGNPFFLLEVLRSLQADHVLKRRDDGAWTMASTRVEIHVPDSVRDLIQTQIARLADDDREVLDVASVLGAEFDPEVLAEVLGQPKIALLKKLSSLERKHRLIRAVGRRCRFDHLQLREMLYEGVMEGLREEYHGQVALVLTKRAATKAATDGASELELLRHCVLGGRGDLAVAHVTAGLRHAAQAYHTDDGARLAERFLAVAGDVAGPAVRAEVRLELAGFLDHEGLRSEERATLDAATTDAHAAGDDALLRRVLDRRLLLSFATGEFAGAEVICRDAFRLASRRKDRDAALAALTNLAAALRCRGRYEESAAALRRALSYVLHEQSRLRRSIVLTSLAMVESQRGRRRTSQRLFLDALAIARDFGIGQAGDLADSRHPEHDELRDRFLGLSRALGRSTESRVDGERTILLGAELPRRLREAGALAALAAVATHLGMHDDARGLLIGALKAARDATDQRSEAAMLHALGENAVESRAPEVARKWFSEALDLRRRIGHRPGVCETLLALGQLAALSGSIQTARPYLEEATELAPALEMPSIAALARATSALLHAREGHPERARAELDEARMAFAAPGPLSIASRVEGMWFAALTARTLGDEAAAAQHLASAWEVLQDIASRMDPQERHAFLFETSPNREIAEAAGASAR
ncbi:MAG: protein kinase [Planctomycetes bacterium]|nr:protein kinase [Planctomycetota bacterium]